MEPRSSHKAAPGAHPLLAVARDPSAQAQLCNARLCVWHCHAQRLPITHHRPSPIAHHPSPITHCPSPTARHPLPTLQPRDGVWLCRSIGWSTLLSPPHTSWLQLHNWEVGGGKEGDRYLSWWTSQVWSRACPRELVVHDVNLVCSRSLAVYSCLCSAPTLKSGLVLGEGPPGLAQRLSCRMPGRRDQLDGDVSCGPMMAEVCTPRRAGDHAVLQAGHSSHLPAPRLGLHHTLQSQPRCWGHSVMEPLKTGSIPRAALEKRGREGPEPAQTPRHTLWP